MDLNINVRNLKAQTAATGTNWTAWASQTCRGMRVHNPNAVDLDVRRNGSGDEITIPAYGVRTFLGLMNANQLSVRRTDTSNTQVYAQAELYA